MAAEPRFTTHRKPAEIKTPHERLRWARENAGFLSAAKAAEKFGWTEVTLRSHENGIRGFQMPAAKNYAKAFKVSWTWLMDGGEDPRGQGAHIESADMAPDDELADALTSAQARLEGWTDKMTLVRELDAQAAAGPNVGLKEISTDNIEEMTRAVHGFPAEGFRQLYGAAPEEIGIIDVIGDSNVPDLFPGQKVMVHFGDKTPSPPGFFVLWDGLGVVIKQIEHIANSDPPRLKISSRNVAYEPYERVMGEAHILGRVLGHWRRL